MTRSNIGTVVESYGLKVVGSKLCCPKHGERTPSLHIYEDTESFYCFGCEWSGDSITFIRFMDNCSFPAAVLKYRDITGDDVSFELREDYENRMGSEFNEDVHTRIKENTGVDSKGYRGIRTDISKWFGIRYEYSQETGDVAKTLYPCTIGGELTGYKVRTHPKDFTNPYGETGKGCDLFGQFRFKTFNHTLLICSGEHDQLAAFQMLKDAQKNKQYDPVAVVSPTIGEGGAYKQAQAQYEWINQFKKIVVAFDNDKAGEEATKKLVEVLPRGKVFIMKMRYKDPNDYVLMGKETEFISDFWAAKPYTPAGVFSSAELYKKALEYADSTKLSLPDYLPKANEMFQGGLVKGEITVIFAGSGQGKSTFINSFTTHWALRETDETVGVLSLEATVDKYSTSLLSDYLGVNLLRMSGEERKSFLSREDVKDKIEQMTLSPDGKARFYVCDDRGADIDVVKEKILEMIIKLGVTILIIDPETDLRSGMDLSQQEELSTWFKKLLKQYPHVSLILVAHVRKRGSNDKDKSLTEDSVMGSSTLIKSAGQLISLERNKLDECPIKRNVTTVTIHKNRHSSTTGSADEVYYDWKSGKLYNFEEWKKENPHMKVG